MRAPAYGQHDAPAAIRWAPKRYLLCPVNSLARVGLKFKVSSFSACLYFKLRGGKNAAGAPKTRIDVILGREEPDISLKVRNNLERRFGQLKPPGEVVCAFWY